MKSLLSFRITVDHEDRNTLVYAHIKLYREEAGLIWRIDGENGDECAALPRPKSIKSAKDDARAVFPNHSPFAPKAAWL